MVTHMIHDEHSKWTPGVDANAFKDAFASVPTAVSVLTVGPERDPYGVTLGSFAALSLEPPLFMFALKRDSQMLSRLPRNATVGVNVLSAGQSETAADFAASLPNRFARTPWRADRDLPRIDGAAAWLVGIVRDLITLGDHVLITALIVHTAGSSASPLLYVDRSFATAQPIEPEARESAA